MNTTQELFRIADTLFAKFNEFDFSGLHKVIQVAEEIGKSWSGSCLGYHSRVYYKDLIPVPPSARFSEEWGFMKESGNDTVGDWVEYDSNYIVSVIVERADNIELDAYEKFASDTKDCFEGSRDRLLSNLSTVLENSGEDKFILDLIDQIKKEIIYGAFEYAQQLTPISQQKSRDMYAVQAGVHISPHILMIAKAKSFLNSFHSCEKLGKYAKHSAFHLENLEKEQRGEERIGEKIFIGHGPSTTWRDVKDFIQDRLHLPWDEFNRMSVGGVSNKERLSSMLNEAAFAFLIMTAEDEQADNKLHARLNIVHEAGLFQGRIGFGRAIILLEEGVEEFFNITGLEQIRFPKGNIFAIFDDIRRVLERENIIE